MENGDQFINSLTWIITIAVLAAILLPQMFKILREYERAVVFRLGKYQGTKGPGLIVLIPFIDKIERVDLRVLTINVDRQEVITKDNVTVHVDAITFFRVIDAEDAVIQVEQYIHATSMLAQTTLRSIVGQVELDELLAEREKVNKNIQEIIDRQTDPWGIKVVSVEVRDVVLPENMKRAMARQAETERERRAKVINAEGEFQAAERLVEAATMMKEAPMALQLRFLQTMTDISEENATFAFIPLPMEMLEVFKNMSGVQLPPEVDGNDGDSSDNES
ncbi:SPFH domain-containing protein [Aliifodinibius salicampi]|uniref:SPFH domain-containing protein n=1 Tax=Fodinibius salicampi TaxID=1920655 RepID=A0ABT3Q184_9BACT|nr:slipin family protein [Fodinibius salicampi]MCW9713821.1 SPFH domain-containing protein [Fodinibius salicampi]